MVVSVTVWSESAVVTKEDDKDIIVLYYIYIYIFFGCTYGIIHVIRC